MLAKDVLWARALWGATGDLLVGDLLAATAMSSVLRRGLAISLGAQLPVPTARGGGEGRSSSNA